MNPSVGEGFFFDMPDLIGHPWIWTPDEVGDDRSKLNQEK